MDYVNAADTSIVVIIVKFECAFDVGCQFRINIAHLPCYLIEWSNFHPVAHRPAFGYKHFKESQSHFLVVNPKSTFETANYRGNIDKKAKRIILCIFWYNTQIIKAFENIYEVFKSEVIFIFLQVFYVLCFNKFIMEILCISWSPLGVLITRRLSFLILIIHFGPL